MRPALLALALLLTGCGRIVSFDLNIRPRNDKVRVWRHEESNGGPRPFTSEKEAQRRFDEDAAANNPSVDDLPVLNGDGKPGKR